MSEEAASGAWENGALEGGIERESAREILRALNADLDGPDDPQVQEALELAQRDPELRDWWERHRREDARIGGLLRGFTVPTGLMEQLNTLAPKERGQGAAQVRSKRGLVLGWCGAAAVLLGVSLTALHYANRNKIDGAPAGISDPLAADAHDFGRYRVIMVGELRSLTGLDFRNKDLDKIRTWLLENRAPVGNTGLEALDAIEGMGCRILEWQGHHVSLICFRDRKGEAWHLFTIARDVFDQLPEEELNRILVIDHRETKGWPDGEVFHLVVAGVDAKGKP